MIKQHFSSLLILNSINKEDIPHFEGLGIFNISDLLFYAPIKNAQYIKAAKEGLLKKDDVLQYLNTSVHSKSLQEIYNSSTSSLLNVGQKSAALWEKIGIKTIAELCEYSALSEAENLVNREKDNDYDPYAPDCVLPRCKKFSRNSKSYVSFFKQAEIRNQNITVDNAYSDIARLFNFGKNDTPVLYLGYFINYLQDWVYMGVHLGEPLGSVPFIMGQDTQVSILDWKRINTAIRKEDSRFSELLTNVLTHQRAVDEVARATAEEHQHGATSSFSANAATAGSFVAAGAVVGGIGGGISGALAGLAIGNVANAAGGAPTIGGAVAGTAIGSIAGAAAGSLVFSGATALGFVDTDARGDREIFAKSAQTIQERTVQNSSSIRSFWSNIVEQSVQEESQRIQTNRVTNHNKIHGLNAMYFEVLNEYRVQISPKDFSPIIFIPFKPFTFSKQILARYWWILRSFINDKNLVRNLDEHFINLNGSTNTGDNINTEDLPDINDVRANSITVELNVDGSAMEDAIMAIAATFSLVVPIAGIAAYVANTVRQFIENMKRDGIEVSIVTTDGEIKLDTLQNPSNNINYIGIYRTSSNANIKINSIEQVKIKNNNTESSFSIPGVFEFDINELVFEEVSVSLSLGDKGRLSQQVTDIGTLERKQKLSSNVAVKSGKNKKIGWDIALQLSNKFQGIRTQIDEINAEAAEQASIDAQIANLISFLNANKFTFTRLILQSVEQEQMMTVLEKVEINNLSLSTLANTTPIGFTGNHAILLLKKYSGDIKGAEPLSVRTNKLMLLLEMYDSLKKTDNKQHKEYVDSLKVIAAALSGEINKLTKPTNRDKNLASLLKDLSSLLATFPANAKTGKNILNQLVEQRELQKFILQLTTIAESIIRFIQKTVSDNESHSAFLTGYFDETDKFLSSKLNKVISSTEVSLPSPAVFMEPVLSQSKGAELYDMRRNSHYDILPAPAIGTTDPNTIRTISQSLTPTVPQSNLNIISPPANPLPNSINTALGEAGKLDLSTLINSNANTLTTTLSNLSNLAGELAKASTQLTGDAQKQALGAAADIAKQIGTVLESANKTPIAPSAPLPQEAPKEQVPVPKTTQEKAEVIREIIRINAKPIPKEEKDEEKKALGVEPVPSATLDYSLGIRFLDENNKPFNTGSFTLSLLPFETGETVDIDNGNPINMDGRTHKFIDVLTLTKGRTLLVSVATDLNGAVMLGEQELILPDKPDISLTAQIAYVEKTIKTNNIKTGVDQTMSSVAWKVALGVLFNAFMNDAIELGFKLAKINAATGEKIDIDLKGEYNRASSNTNTNTNTSSTEETFVFRFPSDHWDIIVR